MYTQIIKIITFFKKNFFLSWHSIKMGRSIIDFGEENTRKKELYSNDNIKIFNINNININEILISKRLFPEIINLN